MSKQRTGGLVEGREQGIHRFVELRCPPGIRASNDIVTTSKNSALPIAEKIVVWSISKQRTEGFVEGREQGIHPFVELRCRRGIRASNDIVTTTKNSAIGIAEKSVIAPIAINRVCAETSKYFVIAALT